MAKVSNEKHIKLDITIEGMKETLDQIMSFCKEMVEKEDERSRRSEEKEVNFKIDLTEEKEMVKDEFDRICECLKKAQPGTDEYYNLTRDLRQIKNIIMGY